MRARAYACVSASMRVPLQTTSKSLETLSCECESDENMRVNVYVLILLCAPEPRHHSSCFRPIVPIDFSV